MKGKAGPRGEPTFLGASQRRWSLMSDVAAACGIFAAVGAAFAGGWAVFEYSEAKEAERASQTLALIDSWETQGYRTAYGELREAYEVFITRVPAAEMATAGSSTRARQNLLGKFNDEIAMDPLRREQVRQVVYFFNRLSLCEKASLCSRKTAAIFFDDTVRTFLDVFQPYIASNAQALPGNESTVADLSRRLDLRE